MARRTKSHKILDPETGETVDGGVENIESAERNPAESANPPDVIVAEVIAVSNADSETLDSGMKAGGEALDSGMKAGLEPVFDGERDVERDADEGGQDRGLGAGMQDDEAEVIALPAEEMQVPDEETARELPRIFSAGAYAEPGPGSGLVGDKPPEQTKVEEADKDLLDILVTNSRMEEMWNRITAASSQVALLVPSLQIARQMYNHVQAARNELMAGRDHYEEAERFVNEVEFRTGHSQSVRKSSASVGTLLFIYEFVLSIGLVVVLLGAIGDAAWQAGSARTTYIATSMLFGAFGGVIGAVFALIKHVAVEQDFESQHSQWYLFSPILGAGMGLVFYVILLVGMLSTFGGNQSGEVPIIIYLLAWLGGYQHNVFSDIIKRVLKVLEQGSNKEEAKAPETKE